MTALNPAVKSYHLATNKGTKACDECVHWTFSEDTVFFSYCLMDDVNVFTRWPGSGNTNDSDFKWLTGAAHRTKFALLQISYLHPLLFHTRRFLSDWWTSGVIKHYFKLRVISKPV